MTIMSGRYTQAVRSETREYMLEVDQPTFGPNFRKTTQHHTHMVVQLRVAHPSLYSRKEAISSTQTIGYAFEMLVTIYRVTRRDEEVTQ